MATKWKKVYVPGKGDRWTDGNGNYRLTDPTPGEALKSAGRSLKNQLGKIGQGYSSAAARTAERLAEEEDKRVSSGFGSNQRFKRTEREAQQIAAGQKPNNKPNKIDPSKYDMDSEPPKGKNQVQPAETKPAKPPVKASEQRTTTTSSSTRQSAPAKRDTRNDEYNRLRIKANKSGSAEDRKAAESEGMKAWRKANPKLAEALDRRNAAKNKETPKPEAPASKRGSNSPTSGSKPMEGGSFNDRGMFDRKKRKKSGGGGSYA